MAFPRTPLACRYSSLSVSRETRSPIFGEFNLLFDGTSTGRHRTLQSVRNFSAVGNATDITSVGEYRLGQALSIGTQGATDEHTLEFNFYESDWAETGNSFYTTGRFKDALDRREPVWFQLTMLDEKPPSYNASADGIGSVDNYLFYFYGVIEGLELQPARDDAVIGTMTLGLLSEYFGPYTLEPWSPASLFSSVDVGFWPDSFLSE